MQVGAATARLQAHPASHPAVMSFRHSVRLAAPAVRRAAADYDRNGFDVGTPPHSGDYFLPGGPLEGWSVEFNASGNEERLAGALALPVASVHGIRFCECAEKLKRYRRYICKGAHSYFGVSPVSVADVSTPDRLGATWIAIANSSLKVSAVTSFGVNDTFVTTTVTLENVGDVLLNEVEYMRNVDPDQEEVCFASARSLVIGYLGLSPSSPSYLWCCSRGRSYTPRTTTWLRSRTETAKSTARTRPARTCAWWWRGARATRSW